MFGNPEQLKGESDMWASFCDVYSPNAEKQEFKTGDAVSKYTKIALIRHCLKRVLGKK